MKKRNLPLKVAAVFLMFSFGNAQAQDFKSIISAHLSSTNIFLKANLSNFEVINEDFSTSMKGDVIKVQQSYNGIPVFNALGTAFIKKDKVINFNENFTKNFITATDRSVAKSGRSVFENVAKNFNLKNSAGYRLVGINDKQLDDAFVVKNRLIYFHSENNDLKLAYEFVFEEMGTSNYWNIIADATSGEILLKDNLTLFCSFHHDAYSHDYSSHIPEGFTADFEQESFIGPTVVAAPLNASYRVFALPLESPNHGSRTLVENPWLRRESPDGWHTIAGGSYTGSFTTTMGNNVHAYEDTAASNTPGVSPDGGAARVFDFPLSNSVSGNLPASTTNLFYVNNMVHDIFYRLGFTESARNFQAWNFGKGGLENDYVMAESQDGGGRNNANFATPGDGARPRMQMYLWDPANIDRVFYNTPPEAVGRKVENVVSTTFGPELTSVGVTADVTISPVLDACTALPSGSLQSKIGLIERGTCDFVTKVKNAQNAGASAVIIYSLQGSAPTSGMAGEDATIVIPSVLIPYNEGVYMKSLINGGKNVNITLKYDEDSQNIVDASFDNGIVIHEYGHGISNRNTGNGSTCLSSTSSKEQMGEGWSDFFALMLTNRPGDNASVGRGIGTFSDSQPINGGGIRPAKYSPDFTVNNFDYSRTNGMEYTNASNQVVPNVHAIGFVWATMLWDLHWKYAEKYGYSSDVTASLTNGSTRVLQLVTDALKLQACNPTFIDGRNAILQAEMNTTGGADKCMIWNAFAKRGLGVNASAGSKTDINDQLADFTVPAECVNLATSEAGPVKSFSIYPNPAKNEFFLKSAKNISGKVIVEIFDASGKLVSSQKISATDAVNTQTLVNGVYVVKVSGLGVNYSSKLMIKK